MKIKLAIIAAVLIIGTLIEGGSIGWRELSYVWPFVCVAFIVFVVIAACTHDGGPGFPGGDSGNNN